MKRIIINTLIVMMLVFTGSMFAQPRGGDHQPPPLPDSTEIAQMVDELAARLELTVEQKNQIDKLFRDHFSEVKQRMEKGRVPREEMEALRAELEKAVKALLDNDQRKEFDKFMKEHTPGPPPRGGH